MVIPSSSSSSSQHDTTFVVVPGVMDNFNRDHKFRGEHSVPLEVWDSRRGEIYDRLLPLFFAGVDVVVLRFGHFLHASPHHLFVALILPNEIKWTS